MDPSQTPRVLSGRYELSHLVARGGMAEVYRAHDRLLDRPVALKVLFPELSVDRAFVERFRREAQAAANLSHPNIVPVFDWGEDGGTYFIVMEFIDGRPLSAVLKSSGPLAPTRAADIGAHVALALDYAHRHLVIHRDVKPGNVLITDEGQVKVTDFGIARAVNTDESLTQTGAVMGTATYFSPEQAEGLGVDSRSDIYSLGVVLFEMVAGRPPFLGDTPVAVASKHVRDVAPTPREINPAVPLPLETVIMKAMAKAPEQRYPTAEDLRADLLRFVEGRPILADSVAATTVLAAGTTQMVGTVPAADAIIADAEAQREAEEQRRKTRRLVLFLLLMLIVLGVIVFFLGRSLGYWGVNSSFAMPNVIGERAAMATHTLQQNGLTVGSAHTVHSPLPSGEVVATQPPPGAEVKKSDVVRLSVSAGPLVTITVPNVVNQSVTDAEVTLQAANLGYKVTKQVAPKPGQQGNQVVSQSPVGGAKVPSGYTVDLVVTAAANTATVPNVTGQSPAAAGNALGNAMLAVGNTTQQCSNSIGQNLVITTNP